MSTRTRLTVFAVALFAIAGCHGSHGHNLALGPYLILNASGPGFVTISWDPDPFGVDPAPIRLEIWRWDEDDYKFRELEELAPDTTIFTDPSLVADWDYEYRLYAYFEKGPKKDSVTLRVPAEIRGAAPAKAAWEPQAAGPGEVPWLGLLPGEPRLSPDSARIVYAEAGRLALLDLATGGTTLLPDGGRGPAGGAAFLPGGERLVVSAGPAGREDLFLVALTGEELLRLTAAGAGDRDPDVSPDGTRVAFVRDGTLWVLDFGTAEAGPLGTGPAGKPRWSPLGDTLAFVRAGAEDFDLFAWDGIGLPLAAGASGRGPLVWSPDGRSVWFHSRDGGVRPAPVSGGGR
jgi:dipeptidyl aminopeptidase/acylaminoacyl peptidase